MQVDLSKEIRERKAQILVLKKEIEALDGAVSVLHVTPNCHMIGNVLDRNLDTNEDSGDGSGDED